jgi:hypothetical protein
MGESQINIHISPRKFFHLTPGPADGSGKGLEKQGFFGRDSGRRRYNRGIARGVSAAQFRRGIFAAESLFEI